jgi:hypothetical protein
MTRDDVLCYLDKCRKTENEDPLHKWIGSYNTKLVILSNEVVEQQTLDSVFAYNITFVLLVFRRTTTLPV